MSTALAAGFAEPVLSAQSTFRAVMDALARPTSIQSIKPDVAGPAPMNAATAAIALTLLDQDTPVWLDPALATTDVKNWIRFHTGAPIVAEPARCAFALIGDASALPAFSAFNPGTPEYPDRSTTIVMQAQSLNDGAPLTFTGPGIRGDTCLRVTPLPADFAARWRANQALFPRGVDLIFCAGDHIAALPRSSRLIEGA